MSDIPTGLLDKPRFVTITEFARIMGVSRYTLNKALMITGVRPDATLDGGTWLFAADSTGMPKCAREIEPHLPS